MTFLSGNPAIGETMGSVSVREFIINKMRLVGHVQVLVDNGGSLVRVAKDKVGGRVSSHLISSL
jgi:hypothetical protein